MDTANWITLGSGLIAGLGIGSGVTVWIQHSLKLKEAAYQSQRQELEKRYKVIIILMYTAFDFERNKKLLRIHRPDLEDHQAVLEELKVEWFNMLLFASQQTLETLRSFIQTPDKASLQRTALASCWREIENLCIVRVQAVGRLVPILFGYSTSC
jgi:hypothetical protein